MKKFLALLLSASMLSVSMTALAETENGVNVDYVKDKITIKGNLSAAAEDRLATLVVINPDKDISKFATDNTVIKWADQCIVDEKGNFSFEIDAFNFGDGEYTLQVSAAGINEKFEGSFKYTEADMETALITKINKDVVKGGMNDYITKHAKARISELDATVVADYMALKATSVVDEAMVEGKDYTTLAGFVSKLRVEVDKQKEEEKDAPAGGGGGGGGGGGSRNPITGGGAVAGGADAGLVAEPSENPFLDIASDYWGKDAIVDLYKKGIVKGQGNGYFRPANTITRAEFVQMVVVAFGFNADGDAVNFTDVTDNDWFANSVRAAYANGVVNGTTATTFSPLSNITRQDMMTILYNAAKAKGVNLTSANSEFTDAESISGYAQDAVSAMVGSNVVSGYPDGSVKPLNNASRAEAAAMLSRLLEVK